MSSTSARSKPSRPAIVPRWCISKGATEPSPSSLHPRRAVQVARVPVKVISFDAGYFSCAPVCACGMSRVAGRARGLTASCSSSRNPGSGAGGCDEAAEASRASRRWRTFRSLSAYPASRPFSVPGSSGCSSRRPVRERSRASRLSGRTKRVKWCPGLDSNQHPQKSGQGPQPCVSTNSTTWAKRLCASLFPRRVPRRARG